MSLTSALSTAVSGLQAAQQNLQLISNNVTNANTVGYTRKTAVQEARTVAGIGQGVQVSNYSRQVDLNLLRQINGEFSTLQNQTTLDSYYNRIQAVFGTPESNGSVSHLIQGMADAFEQLAADPNKTLTQLQAVDSAQSLASKLASMTEEIQSLRESADQEIEDAVTEINNILSDISKLNTGIAKAVAAETPATDMQDSLDLALKELSGYMDISYFFKSDGRVAIYTQAGRPLIDEAASTLSHTASSMSPEIAYPAVIDSLDVGTIDITTELRNGKLKALVDLRDTELPNLQTELETLAAAVREEINKVHNEGTGFPPLASMTGTLDTTGLPNASDDLTSASGTFRILVTDSSGAQVESFVVDLTGDSDVSDVLASINGAAGNTTVTAAVNTDGELTLTTTGDGIALQNIDSAITGTVTTSAAYTKSGSFGYFFGMNDLMVVNNEFNEAGTMSVRSDIVSTPSLVSRGQLNLIPVGQPNAGDYYLSEGDNAVAQLLADKFTDDISFSASGNLGAVTGTLAEYGARIISEQSGRASANAGDLDFQESFVDQLDFQRSSISDVNVDEELANLIVFEQSFAAASRVIATTNSMFEELVNII
jgi:flagellar hook-associated protein 1 FlgK